MGFFYPFGLKGWTLIKSERGFYSIADQDHENDKQREARKVNDKILPWLADMLRQSGEPLWLRCPVEKVRQRYVAFQKHEMGFASEYYRMNQFRTDEAYLLRYDKDWLTNT
jgi:hypothetical protein